MADKKVETLKYYQLVNRVFGSELSATVSLLMLGCCSNVFTLEKILMATGAHKCTMLVTLLQFMFVSAVGMERHVLVKSQVHPSLRSVYQPQSRLFPYTVSLR